MSSRRGNALQETVEEVEAVVRPGPGLGVVLHRAARHLEQLKTLDGAVIQVHMRQRSGAEVRLPAHGLVAVDRAGPGWPERREAVILGGDLNLPGLKIAHRVVGSVMSERELERLESDGTA